MRYGPRIALLSLAFAIGTAIAGWWAVPVLAIVWGLLERGSHRPAVAAALAAVLGWGLLLVWSAASGRFAPLVTAVGGIAQVPGVALLILTFAFSGALAWSAARVVGRR